MRNVVTLQKQQKFLCKDVLVGNALLDMYTKCGTLEMVQQVLEELPIRDDVSWNFLIDGYGHEGKDNEVYIVLKRCHMKLYLLILYSLFLSWRIVEGMVLSLKAANSWEDCKLWSTNSYSTEELWGRCSNGRATLATTILHAPSLGSVILNKCICFLISM
mgnify:FL=1